MNFILARTLGGWACSLLLLVFATSAHAVLINPDFESGGFDGWQVVTTATGVANASVTSFDIDQDGTTSNVAAFSTGWSVYDDDGIAQGGGIAQSFESVEGSLNLSLNVAVAVENEQPNIVSSSGGGISIYIDEQLVAFHEFGTVLNHTVVPIELNGQLLVGEGPHLLTILFTRSFFASESVFQYVDNVELSGSAVVPLPSAMLLFLTATGFGFSLSRLKVS